MEAADESTRQGGFLDEGHLRAVGSAAVDVRVAAQLPRPFGHFTLERVLGEGGMGTVYEATQDQPRRRVAAQDRAQRDGVARVAAALRRETDTLALLQHPGIAQIYEAGRVVDDSSGATVPYIAMELVEGARSTNTCGARGAIRGRWSNSSSPRATRCSTRTRRASCTAT
ncbi:MAG: hypothetical protein U0575_09415 [Phycisphaerales bacterium]